jgi:hypothetical protein
MIATNVDSERRATLPPRFAPHDAITISDLDEDAIVIRRHRESAPMNLIVVPAVGRLADDPEMDGFAAAAVAAPATYEEPQ